MPLYGYIYQGVSSQSNGLFSRYSSAKSISYNTVRSSYLSNTAFSSLRHANAQVPYLYGENTFITYEDPQSIAAKVSLAKSMGLAGIGAWELSPRHERHPHQQRIQRPQVLNHTQGAGPPPAPCIKKRPLFRAGVDPTGLSRQRLRAHPSGPRCKAIS